MGYWCKRESEVLTGDLGVSLGDEASFELSDSTVFISFYV
jgi:hypothetical protein